MAVITKEEMAPFRSTGIIENSDWVALANLSRKFKLKRNETGFSNMQMKNFAINQNTCSPDTKRIIIDYFYNKLGKLKKEVDRVFK